MRTIRILIEDEYMDQKVHSLKMIDAEMLSYAHDQEACLFSIYKKANDDLDAFIERHKKQVLQLP